MKEINFTWHQFDAHNNELFRTLFETKKFSDVTLVSDDQQQIKAHKFILSASSSIFDDFLSNNNAKSSLINLPGIRHHELELILQFIYLGRTKCFQDLSSDVMNVAKYLKIREFEHEIESKTDIAVDMNTFQPIETFLRTSKKIGTSLENNIQQIDTNFKKKTGSKLGSKNIISNDNNEDPLIESTFEFGLKERILNGMNDDPLCEFGSKDIKNEDQLSESTDDIKFNDGYGEPIKYFCEMCDRGYSKKFTLLHHVKAAHGGKRYPCRQCNFSASRTYHLNRHVSSKHEKVRYICQICNYKAIDSRKLKIHIEKKHNVL